MKSGDGLYELYVSIGDEVQPEYVKDGRTYVESKLDTPQSKMVDLTEGTPWGKETTQWPVTPYKITVQSTASVPIVAEVFVDGVFVHATALTPSANKATVDGFDTHEGIKEFLFSFPRYPRDEFDRMEATRLSKLGTVSAKFCPVTEIKTENGYKSRFVVSDFAQGNKKDADMAGGSLFMSTTRPGNVVRQQTDVELSERTYYNYNKNVVIAELVVLYRVQRVLEQLGIKVQKRDVMKENRRLFGATFDAPEPAPATSDQANGSGGSTLATQPAATSADLADKPIKQRRVDLDD